MSLTRALTAGVAQLLKTAASVGATSSTKALAATVAQAGHFYASYNESISRSRNSRSNSKLTSSEHDEEPTDLGSAGISEEDIVNMLGLEGARTAPSSSSSVASQIQRWLRERRADSDGLEESSEADSGIENTGIWLMAVPKRKPSHAVKRKRQMNPLYQNEKEITHAYPCPKCDKGYIKLRHHLCPCDQEKLNCRAVVKVSYAVGVKKEGGQQQPEAKTAEATTKQ